MERRLCYSLGSGAAAQSRHGCGGMRRSSGAAAGAREQVMIVCVQYFKIVD